MIKKGIILLMLLAVSVSSHAQSGLTWLSLDEGQTVASTEEKTLFIFVEAEWCAFCKKMKKKVFPDEAVSAMMENRFIPVSVDLDSTHPVSFNGIEYTERSFAEDREVAATPTMIFADHEGNILGTTSGYYDADRFLLLLTYVESDLFQDMTFEEFEKRSKRRSSNDD